MKQYSIKSLLSLLLTIGFLSQISAKVTYSTNLIAIENELGNVLEWTTSMESNNKHFVVEKSTDNVKFTEMATIESKGNSVKNNKYYFVDMNLGSSNDKFYYRLKQVDMDGTSSHSKVASLTKTGSNHFSMDDFRLTNMPDEYILSYKSKVAGEMKLDIVNTADLSIVHTETYTASVGFHDLKLNMNHLDAGDYELVFTLDNEKETIAINKASTVNTQNNMMSRKATKKVNRN